MSFISKIRKHGGMILAALCLAAQAFTLSYGANLEGANTTSNKLTFGGDFRLRQEDFFNKTAGQPDRHRQRMRLRFGVKAEMDKWDMNLRLASGTGEQTSTNQTFTNGFNQKSLNIDQAYATWKPSDLIKVHGGKMNNPFWRLYSTDVMWDADINPEGLAEQLSYDLNQGLTVFGNFGQLPMFEQSANYRDPYMLGNQIGVQTKFGEGMRWNFAVADYNLVYEESAPLLSTSSISNDPTMDQPVVQGDNRRSVGNGAQLVGSYHMLNFTTEFGFHLLLPVRLQGDWVQNVAAGRVNGQSSGYQAGLILNSAKTAGTWEFGYFNKYLEANATLSDFADSDWGNGGTNRKGHIVWLAYCPWDYVTLQGKYFMTKRIDPTIGVSAPYAANQTATYRDINRFQLDVVVKF